MRTSINTVGFIVLLELIAGPLLAGQLSTDLLTLDANILHRDSDTNTIYLYNNNGTVNNPADDIPLAGTGSFSDDADVGFRLAGTKQLSNKWSINVGILSSELSKTDSFTDPSSQLEIFRLPITDNFDSATSVSAAYNSKLQNIEVNAVYRFSGSLDLFAGLTQIKLDERFKIVSNDPLSTVPGVGTYTINTNNKLIGPQIGISYNYKPGTKYSLYVIGKLAWMNNDASQNQYVDDAPTFIRSNNASDSHSSSMYDVKLGVNYYFTQQLAMNLAYQYIKVSDVVLAEGQFDTTIAGSNALKISDGVSWAGFSIGLGYYF